MASKRRALSNTRDTYHVLGHTAPIVKGSASLALVAAQERLLRDFTKPSELTVERHTLFGPPAELYRVVRDENGVIRTFTLAHED